MNALVTFVVALPFCSYSQYWIWMAWNSDRICFSISVHACVNDYLKCLNSFINNEEQHIKTLAMHIRCLCT
jgi:hypothetical protein